MKEYAQMKDEISKFRFDQSINGPANLSITQP